MRWFRRRKLEQDLDRELQSDLELQAAELEEAGLSANDARYAARRAFGNRALVKEEVREMWGWTNLENLLRDTRYALHMMRRSPGLSCVAILSLALGIGANTAIFSLVDAVMLRLLPVQDPEHLVLLSKRLENGTGHAFSYAGFTLFRDQNHVLSGLLAFENPERARVSIGTGELEQVSRSFVTGDYFELLGVNPVLGHTFSSADDRVPGGAPYAVLSYSYWERRFAADPSVLGKRLVVDEIPVTIVGVAPPGFTGVEPGIVSELWLPAMMMDQRCLANPNCQTFGVLARLKPGVGLEQARAELDILHRQHLSQRAVNISNSSARARFLNQSILLTKGGNGLSPVGDRYSTQLKVLMAVVGMLLLIACANIANLLLARSAARQREIAVRVSMGASRGRLIRQLLTESVLLSLIGGVVGVFFAQWGSRMLVTLVSDPGNPLVLDLGANVPVLLFTAGVSILCGLLFGIAPALRASRADLATALKAKAGRADGAQGWIGLGRLLVVSQIALSLLLLVGAGLFVRSLSNLRALATGFNRQNVSMFELSIPRSWKAPEAEAVANRVLDRIQSLPGVLAASTSFPLVLEGGTWDDTIATEGESPVQGEDRSVNLVRVSRRFFGTIETPLVAGRGFGPGDTATSPSVALVNEAFVRRFFNGTNPVGRRFKASKRPAATEIVGIVRDSRLVRLRDETPPMAFLLADQIQGPLGAVTNPTGGFLVRSIGDPATVLSSLPQILKEIDPNLLPLRPRTLVSQMDQALAQDRMIAKLSSFFSAAALLLACIGLYGIMSYTITRRTNEIGIRIALGARTSDVILQIIRETLVLAGSGIVLGISATVLATRLLGSMLFRLKPYDPLTIFMTAVLLLSVALLAGYLPARRAARVDPIAALRYE
ncbi:MAG TPA: ABC transporter permease [Bryobacteraceae bacterium]|nr:ABC transporter permease [Bryobacteraceae bacterium]